MHFLKSKKKKTPGKFPSWSSQILVTRTTFNISESLNHSPTESQKINSKYPLKSNDSSLKFKYVDKILFTVDGDRYF